ncbi:MAG: hypothetical protein ACR2FP_09150 [Nocardioidaceae bacterium]
MRAHTLRLLAQPTAAAERGRFLLVTGSIAVAGGLLLVGQRVARLYMDTDGASSTYSYGGLAPSYGGLAPYVTQAGLRPGVVIGAVLVTVPVLALALQALRVGSLARERRMASLRLAGATARDVRTVAAAEAGVAAAAGGLLAGPAYLLCWLMLGVLMPAGLRLVPTPGPLDLLAWAATLLVAAAAGAIAGAVVQRRVVAEPLGVRRRIGPQPPGRANVVGLVAGLLLVVFGFGQLTEAPGGGEYLLLVVVLVGLLLVAFTIGPRLVRRLGGRLQLRESAVDVLVGARLHVDPQTAGRVAAVLVVCGLALGVEALMVSDLLGRDIGSVDDLSFYLTGFWMAAVGVLIVVVVAVLTLLIGAADQLLDARRPLASLVALGVDEQILEKVLRRQQSAAAAPAVVLGVLVGAAGAAYLSGDDALAVGLLPTLLVAAVAGGAVGLVTRFAAVLLRPRLRAATDPENLRVA